MTLVLVVGGVGAVGAVTRYTLDGFVRHRFRSVIPWGTITVNVVGSLVMGFVTGVVMLHGSPAGVRTIVGTGFCGGLTTWSAFSWETIQLFNARQHHAAWLNTVIGPATSLAAAAMGLFFSSL